MRCDLLQGCPQAGNGRVEIDPQRLICRCKRLFDGNRQIAFGKLCERAGQSLNHRRLLSGFCLPRSGRCSDEPRLFFTRFSGLCG